MQGRLQNPGRPVLLPDVNGDSHSDLLFPGIIEVNRQSFKEDEGPNDLLDQQTPTYNFIPNDVEPKLTISDKFVNERRLGNEMILVSGNTGEIIGTSLKLNQCLRIIDITNDGESIDYSCIMNTGNSELHYYYYYHY